MYPESSHGGSVGALLPGLQELVHEQMNAQSVSPLTDTGFDMKQSTSHDSARSPEELFSHVRPSIVNDEGESGGTFSPEVVAEQALQNVLDMTVKMSNKFEDQFVSKYLPRIFPWSMNYDCGGPEYPQLFAKWKASGRFFVISIYI